MSGQPYRYFTDPTKFRTEYMESLGLRADLDTMNYEANKTYKETGQLPAVSQMKDTRSTSDILMDFEKLKIDLISEIAKISSSQFGQMVVQSIISSPLNVDNKLLTFSAQRIDDIVLNLKRNYKYGIKGDNNDAVQFVAFIESMYNDKNYLTASTKSFMNRYGMKTLASASPFSQIYANLVKSAATIRNYIEELNRSYFDTFKNDSLEVKKMDKKLNKLLQSNSILQRTRNRAIIQGKEVVDYIATVLPLIPTNPNMIVSIEEYLINMTQRNERQIYDRITDFDTKPNDDEFKKGYEETGKRIPNYIRKERMREYVGAPYNNPDDASDNPNQEPNLKKDFTAKFNDEIETLTLYLDFLNLGLPNENLLMSLIVQLTDIYSKNLLRAINKLKDELITSDSTEDRLKLESMPSFNSVATSLQSIETLFGNIEDAVQVNGVWNIPELELLKRKVDALIARGVIRTPAQVNPATLVNVENMNQQNINQVQQAVQPQAGQPQAGQPPVQGNNQQEDNDIINGIIGAINMIQDQIDQGNNAAYLQEQLEFQAGQLENALQEYQQNYNVAFVPEDGWGGINLQALGIQGNGIKKRRGRPRGCGIAKPISYKESVKAHAVLDKGIMETPRFVKFGKYLVNNHKLHNEDIFALKRMAGGNIVDIPSIKISKNLGGVIKKMLGGAIPTYSDISKLSEPEKAYLHKVSQNNNTCKQTVSAHEYNSKRRCDEQLKLFTLESI